MARLSLGGSHIGLDIGTSAVRAAEVRGGRSPQVVRFGQVLLPHGAVPDGEVHEPEVVAEALATLWKRAGFRSRSVRIGIANKRVVVRQIEIPAMARADLEGAIRFQAQDYIPIPLSEAVMDFEVLEELSGPDGQPLQRVLVVAAERAMIEPILTAVQRAKLEPEALELNAYPLVRALGGESAVATDAEAIIDVGAGVTNVVIHQGGRIRFTRILPSLGGDDFTQAIVEQLGLDWEEAESLKHRASSLLAAELGVEPEPDEPEEPAVSEPEEGDDLRELRDALAEAEETGTDELDEDEDQSDPAGSDEDEEDTPEAGAGSAAGAEPSPEPDGEDARRAVGVLEQVLQRFTAELRGSVDFYTTQAGAPPLRGAVITGGGSLLGGLRESVGQVLRVPVEPGQVFERVPIGKVKLSADQIAAAQPFLAVAVGLALGGLEG